MVSYWSLEKFKQGPEENISEIFKGNSDSERRMPEAIAIKMTSNSVML